MTQWHDTAAWASAGTLLLQKTQSSEHCDNSAHYLMLFRLALNCQVAFWMSLWLFSDSRNFQCLWLELCLCLMTIRLNRNESNVDTVNIFMWSSLRWFSLNLVFQAIWYLYINCYICQLYGLSCVHPLPSGWLQLHQPWPGEYIRMSTLLLTPLINPMTFESHCNTFNLYCAL